MIACRRSGALTSVLLAVVVVLLLGARSARAAGDDAAVQAQLKGVLDEEYVTAQFGPAKAKVEALLARCKMGCSGQTKGQIYVALGMVASQVGQADEARNDFATALGADPAAALPPKTTPNIQSQFADAKQLVTNTAPAPEAPKSANEEASPPAAGEAPPPTAAPAPEVPPAAGPKKRKIPGWDNVDAFQLASAGLTADLAGKLDQCIDDDRQSLELEEQPRTRLHLSSCERRTGKLLDALRDAQKALEAGIQKRDVGVMKAARARVQDLLTRIPHVTFESPQGASDLHVTFDERDVPADALSKKFSVDPGTHKVHAEGSLNGGVPLQFDQEVDVKEGQLVSVKLALNAPPSEFLTGGQLRCMLQAKTQEEVLKCLPQNRKSIVIRAGMDLAGYADTTHVYVTTPSINGSISSPTQGWNVGGSLIVDMVTAASPDIVSEASSHYEETRVAGVLTGGYKPGLYGVQANAFYGHEPDYISISGGLAFTADLNDKLTTPRIAISRDHDEIGRGPNNFISTLDTTEVETGVSLVLNPTSLLVLTATGQFERGDQSKPYRYIPMFAGDIAPFVPPGASIDLVDEFRLNTRPTEQLPTARDRYALGARFNHRMGTATIRLDQRIYYDTWGLKATTTDGRYVMDFGKHLRLWPHARLNAQTGASFYQLAYTATITQPTATAPGTSGYLVEPLYRTDDRELSPLITLTGGGGARIELGSAGGKTTYGFNFSGDIMYTRYFDALFITFRTAYYGSIGLDAEFE